MASHGLAADYHWDPLADQSNSGGFGIWDLTTLSWNDDDVAPNVAWPNTNDSAAIFGGVGGVVIIDTGVGGLGVTANQLAFTVDGYNIGSDEPSEVITLAGLNAGVHVDAGIATVSGVIAGTDGIVKSGAGTVMFRPLQANTFTGTITVTGGTLDIDGDDRLGNADNDIVLDGGRLDYNSAPADWDPAATRVITIGPGGGTISSSRAIRITDAEQITGSGTLIREGLGTTFALDLQQPNVGFTGNTVVNSGAIEYRNDLALGNTPGQTVTVNGGLFAIAIGPFTGNVAPTLSQPVTLNGGSLGFGNQIGGRYAGDVAVTADSGIQVNDFYQAANRGGVIDGVLSGSSRLTVTGVSGGFVGGTPAFGSVLLRNPGNTFSGTISVGAGAHVRSTQGGGVDALAGATVELAGGALGLAPVVTAAGAGTGFYGRYYNSTKINSGVAGGFDFGTEPMLLAREDATVNYPNTVPAGPGVNTVNMGVLWTGILEVTTPGTYVFSFRSDDGSMIYVDGQMVVANDFAQGPAERFGSINLSAGLHPIIMKYGQGTGGAAAQAYYNGPDTGDAKVAFGSVAGTVTNIGGAKFDPMLLDSPINITTSGDIDLAGADAVSTGAITFQPNASLRVSGVTGFEVLTQSGDVTLDGSNTIFAGTTLIGNQTGTHNHQSAGADLVITGDINEAFPGSILIKDGPRTVSLRGTSTFTGPAFVNAGTLSVNEASAPGEATINPGGVLDFRLDTDGAYSGFLDGAGDVTKTGAGTLSLNAPSPFFGTTTVLDGKLTGLGGVGGPVVVRAGGTLSGTTGVSFSAGSIALKPRSTMEFALGAPTLLPHFSLLDGIAASLADVNLVDAGGLGEGTYRLVDYGGAALTLKQFAGLSIGNGPAAFFYALVNNSAETAVDLRVETPAAINTWTGAQSATWEAGGATNWSAGAYTEGEQVVFGAAATSRNVSGPAVSPQSITVSGPAGTDYTIGNAIGGSLAGGLRKDGENTLRLTGANTFTGPIDVLGGTLVADVSSNASGLGGGRVDLAAGTTLQLNPTATLGVSGLSSRYFSNTPTNAGTGPTNLDAFDFTQVAGAFQIDTNFDPAAYTETNLPAGGLVGYDENTTNASWKNFAIERVGKIVIERAGWYSFHTFSDDGTRIYIDRRLVANANGGHGNIESSGTVFLQPGVHDFRYQFSQGTGGADERISYAGPGIPKQVLPSAITFAAESGSEAGSSNLVATGTPVHALGSATIAVAGDSFTGVELGSLATNGGTITVTGPSTKLLATSETILEGNVTFSNTPDLSLGRIDDLGTPVTITKSGPGRMILDNFAAGADASVISPGAVLDIQQGEVYAKASSVAGTSNPLGSAAIQLNGGDLILDSAVNNVTFGNSISVVKDGTVSTRVEGLTVTLSGGITINAGATLTLDPANGMRGSNANTTIAGQAFAGGIIDMTSPISGDGNLVIRSSQTSFSQAPVSGTVFLRQPATHTGLTTVEGNFGSATILDIRAQGRLLETSGINAPGEIRLTNARLNLHNNNGGNVGDRLPDTFPITMQNGTFRFDGANTAAASETIGAITLAGGHNNLFGGTAGGTAFQTLTAASITRQNRATLRIDANNVGSLTAANGVRFLFTDATGFTDTLVGGDGSTATNGKIVPWVFGGPTGNNRSLVTYDVNGLRTLADTEFAAGLAASTDPTDNVRQTYAGATTVGAGTTQTVNSLVLVNTGTGDATATLLAGTTLNVTSGAIMLGTTDGTARRVVLAAGTINFGDAEGVIFASRREHAVTSQITGTNGLTLSGDGSITLNNSSNNFSGDIHVNLGGSPLVGAIGLFAQNDNSLGGAFNDLYINGSSFRFNSAYTLNPNRTVHIGEAGAAIDTNNQNVGIAGIVTGSGPFYKTNNNTLTLSNPDNDYTGETYIFTGNLVTNTSPQGDIHHYAADGGGYAGTNRVLTFSQTFDGTYGGDIDGVGDVVKAGSGRAIFTGDHSYVGITTINEGALVVNGSISGSTTTVNAGRLEGNGSFFYDVNVGNLTGFGDAILAPGDGIGTLTVGGDVTFAFDGAFELQINTTSLTGDRLVADGAVTLGAGLIPLTAFDLAPVLLTNGEVFTFIEAGGGVFGEFAGLPDGSTITIGQTEFTIDYSANAVALIVPEPSAFLSLLGGLGVLLGARRSRRTA